VPEMEEYNWDSRG